MDDLIEKYQSIIQKLLDFSNLLFREYKAIKMTDTCFIGKLTEIVTGKLNANAAEPNGIYPFFTCSQNESKINFYAFDSKAIIIAGNGDISVKYYEGKFNAYQRTYVLCPSKYFYLFLKECEENIASLKSFSRGSVINFITKDMLLNINIKLNQKSDYYDKKIGEIYKNILTLKNKITLLKSIKNKFLIKYFR